jgi:hypothetical protein
MGFFDVTLFWLLASHSHGLFLPSTDVHKVTLAYWLLVMFLNTLLTILFVTRILWMRKAVIRNLGKAAGKVYVNVISVIVESFVLYTVSAILGFAINLWIFGKLVPPPNAIPLAVCLEMSPLHPFLVQVEVTVRMLLSDTVLMMGAVHGVRVNYSTGCTWPCMDARNRTREGSVWFG